MWHVNQMSLTPLVGLIYCLPIWSTATGQWGNRGLYKASPSVRNQSKLSYFNPMDNLG